MQFPMQERDLALHSGDLLRKVSGGGGGRDMQVSHTHCSFDKHAERELRRRRLRTVLIILPELLTMVIVCSSAILVGGWSFSLVCGNTGMRGIYRADQQPNDAERRGETGGK
jgi:hypothetical protein